MITEEIGLLARGDPRDADKKVPAGRPVRESSNSRLGTQVWREAAILDGESMAQDNWCVTPGWKMSTVRT